MKLTKAELKAIFGTIDFEKIRSGKIESKNIAKAISLEPKNISITKEEVKALAKKIGYVYQEGDENRVFQLTFTDETVDRYGDIVRAEGGDFKNYRMNPVVLPFHDSRAFPIGQTLKLEIDKEAAKVTGLILILQESVDPTGTSEVFYKMLKTNALRTGSVGFIPKKWTFPDEAKRKELGMEDYGVIFDEWELLEFSICSVPANPNALQNAFENKSLTREEVKKAFLAAKEKHLEIPDEWLKAVEAVSTPEIPKKKTLETWFETEESYVREIRDIEEFISDTLMEKEIQADPKVTSLEGKLKSNAELKIHSYIFPKSVWTLEKAQEYFIPVKTGENEKTLKNLISELAGQISELKNKPEEKTGAVLSKKNAELIANAVAAIATVTTSLSEVSAYLTELLNSASKENGFSALPSTITVEPAEAEKKSLYDGEVEKEIKALLEFKP